MSCSVKVICRFRPINARERHEQETTGIGSRQVINFLGPQTVEADHGVRGKQKFDFDRVFQPGSSQLEVYEEGARQIIEDIIQGFNGTMFAYGQTGAGKSFTMFGADIEDEEFCGVIPRSAKHIFSFIENDDSETEYQIKCAFLEIYREQINDLLDPSKVNLKVHESASRGVFVAGLTEETVGTGQEIMDLLKIGEQARAVSCTAMNSVSSRSHSVFMIILIQRTPDGATKNGKLYLVDLAGSEKVNKTGAKDQTLAEAQKINLSLTVLGTCINALVENRPHIPFRDSKLTRILQESLGGNCKTTLMIACSPHEFNLEETISTLKFGQRAKSIKLKAKINAQRSPAEMERLINKLTGQLEVMKKENSKLKKIIAWYKSDEYSPGVPCPLETEETGADEEDLEAARDALEQSFDAEMDQARLLEAMKNERDDAIGERDSLQRDVDLLTTEIQTLKEANTKFEQIMASADGVDPEQIATMKDNLHRYKTELESAKKKLKSTEVELRSAKKNVDALQQRIASGGTSSPGIDITLGGGSQGGASNPQLEAALQKAETDLQKQRGELIDLRGSVGTMQQEIADYKLLIEQMDSEIESHLPSIDGDSLDPEGTVELSTQQYQAMQRKVHLAQSRGGAADRKVEALETQLRQLQAENGKLTDQVVSFKESQESGTGGGYLQTRQLEEYIAMRHRCQSLELEVDTLQRKVAIAKEKLDNELQSQTDTSGKLMELESHNREKEKIIRRLEYELSELATQLQEQEERSRTKLKQALSEQLASRSRSKVFKPVRRSDTDHAFREEIDFRQARARLRKTRRTVP